MVQAAAQLEEELEPMQDAEEFPRIAARARAERVSTALSGSGMVLKLAKSSNEPMSPSGLGAGGKRERANPGELKTGEADAKQPRQAGILQHLTTKRI